MLLGADHVRDREVVVVHHAGEVVEAGPIGPLNHMVLLAVPGKLDPAADGIVDHEGALAGHLQPHHALPSLGLKPPRGVVVEGGEPAAVEKRLAGGLSGLAFLVEFLRSGEVAIGVARRQQRGGGGLVAGRPLRLVVGSVRPAYARPLIPVDAEPLQAVENRLEGCVDVPFGVGVVDPEDELAAPLACEKPVEQRRADTADVKVAGGARRESGADGHRGSISWRRRHDRCRLPTPPPSMLEREANRKGTQVTNLCYEGSKGQRAAARGCPCPGAGVAFSAKPGWRSGESIERAKGRMPVASVRRRAWAAPSGAAEPACPHRLRDWAS